MARELSHSSEARTSGGAGSAHTATLAPIHPPAPRLCAKGKFFFVGAEKLYIRGVTYGPFRPEPDGCEYHHPQQVEADFRQMRACGINALRTYTLPPPWLLDLAAHFGLRVLVGLPWEQHITFLDQGRRARDIEKRIRAGVRRCAGHPALLGYAVGNEVPAPVVRWYGHGRVEQFLQRLYSVAKDQDPDGLVTYVNYPSTEYLELPFLDFVAFNVYLEAPERLRSYLARLHNLGGDRPLLLAEAGLDSLRHGESHQAQTLDWQANLAFASGCAGLFVFSWTDEWHRGGHDILDWRFGLTTTSRQPKPALDAVRHAFQQAPVALIPATPFFSVVICTYNGSRTLRGALQALQQLRYPAYEVIVVDDGSTDATASVAEQFDTRLIRIPNGGLSNARNVGWQAARGELVAYLDDDAAPDPDWLTYLASAFAANDYAGVCGPNVAWPGDGFIAQCVDQAPGNPTHVLLTDSEAEHLPGCNMAFRKACLAAIAGFDAQFRIAGDDVDLCWRLQQHGWKLGFHPAAMVYHHRRGTLRGYWRQQVNYGRAEAMLERKWPEKYNLVGHATWNGRLYNKGLLHWGTWSQRRIYHGTWGSALFQSIYSVAPGTLASVLMLPEWYLLIAFLAVVSACGLVYSPLRYTLLLLVLAFFPPLAHAALSGARSSFRTAPRSLLGRLPRMAFTGLLHFLQPAARLWGRLRQGLTPWRRRGSARLVMPWPRTVKLWSEQRWQSAEQRLSQLEQRLRRAGASVARGGEYDRWDLAVRGGLLGAIRLLMVIEEHGDNRQYVRIRIWPMIPVQLLACSCLFAILAIIAALDFNWTAWALLNLPALFLLARAGYECAAAMAAIKQALAPETLPLSQPQPAATAIAPATALPVQ